ncbi:MAG: hypothetical protein JWM53_4389 [bacterium]|nr:hypothetical protein [bacterium]
MTRTFNIPEERWRPFLRLMNRLALGRPVRVEIVNRTLGDQEIGDKLPLREIDLELKGSERGRLIVSVGDDESEIIHFVSLPTRLAIGIDEVGELQWIAVDERDVRVTILHFERFPELEADYSTR